MKQFFFYIFIQIKRILALLPSFLAVSAASFLFIGTLLFILMNNTPLANSQKKITVGIAGETESGYIQFGIKSLQQLDYSNSYIELKVLDEKKAEKLLRKGKISAYVVLPEGFIESVEYGRNDKQITFVSRPGAQDISTLIKSEVARIIESYITNSQSAIYSMQQILYDSQQMRKFDSLTLDMNLKYIDYVASRENFAEVETLGNKNVLKGQTSYFCGIIFFFIMLMGINSASFFSKRNFELSRILKSKGANSFVQVAGEYLSYLFFVALCFALILFVSAIAVKLKIFTIYEWRNDILFLSFIWFFIKNIPVIMMASSLEFFIYEAVQSLVPQISFQFLISFVLCYISGCFYPMDFFPDFIKRVSFCQPAGAALNYMKSTVKNSGSSELFLGSAGFSLLVLAFYTLTFLSLSVFFRKKKLSKN